METNKLTDEDLHLLIVELTQTVFRLGGVNSSYRMTGADRGLLEFHTYQKTERLTDGWIKCSERMPFPGQAVFYYFNIVGVHEGFYEGDFTFVKEGSGGGLTGDVIYWMSRGTPAAPQHETS